MNHDKIKKLLPLYVDNGLEPEEKKLVTEHLKKCQECRQLLNKYRENYTFLSNMKKEEPPADMVQNIISKTRKQKNSSLEDNNTNNSLIKRLKDFFTFPVKIPAGIIGVATVIILLLLTGIPETIYKNETNKIPDEELQYFNKTEQESIPPSPDTVQYKNLTRSDTAQNQNITSDMLDNRKIIETANLIIEVKDIKNIDQFINTVINNYNGYISNSRSWINNKKRHYSEYRLKIPAASFNKALTAIKTVEKGELISDSVSARDVTEDYMDLEIRLKNLKSQEEKYRQLLDKAANVEEILKIENELNRLRTEIERYQGRKKYLDNQINYSTITVEFRQPEPISSGTSGIIKTIRNALNTMLEQFYQIIILTGTLIPYLILVILVYFIYKKIIRRQR